MGITDVGYEFLVELGGFELMVGHLGDREAGSSCGDGRVELLPSAYLGLETLGTPL